MQVGMYRRREFVRASRYYSAVGLLTSIACHFACAYRFAYPNANRGLCQFS